MSSMAMASGLKRPFSALSNGTASDFYKKRCIDKGADREALNVVHNGFDSRIWGQDFEILQQSLQLLDLSSTSTQQDDYSGPFEPPGAPKMDEARDLSSPISDAHPGMFGDIPDYTSLDKLLPSPEQVVSGLRELSSPIRDAHPGLFGDMPALPSLDNLLPSPKQLVSVFAVNSHETEGVRGDRQHDEVANVGPGLDTVLVPGDQVHPYFWEQPPQSTQTTSPRPFQEAPVSSFAQRAPGARREFESAQRAAVAAAHRQLEAYNADEEEENSEDVPPLISRLIVGLFRNDRAEHNLHGPEAQRSLNRGAAIRRVALRRQVRAAWMRESVETRILERPQTNPFILRWIDRAASSSSH